MRSVDTNVLVRFFVDDDPEQAALARSVIEAARVRSEPLHVPDVALVELVWVLRSRYRRPVAEVRGVVGAILASPEFDFADGDLLRAAHAAWSAGRGDFADYLLRERARVAGALPLLTFDEDLHGDADFAPPAVR